MNLAPLISAINDGHSQAAICANDKRQERKAKEVKTVEMLGKDHLAHLLCLCGVAMEAKLSSLWANMAGAPQGKSVSGPPKCNPIQQEYINQGFLYEHHLPNLSFLTNCKSMNWVPFADSLEGRSVANPFQFTDTNGEAFHSLNSQL